MKYHRNFNIKYLTALFALILLTAGCQKTKTYRIGVSQCSQDDWRNKMNEEINREIMYHEEAEVEIRSADDSSKKQIEDIRYFVDNDFDIIIVSPNEAETLTPVIKEVYEKGMPVIIFDRNIHGDSYTARIGADDVALGRTAATYAASILKNSPKAIEIYGLPGSTPAAGRKEGFDQKFTSLGGKIVGAAAGNWNKEDAAKVADSLLRANPEVDLIYAHNDRMAIGASEVARSLGRNNIKIIGIDAAPSIGIRAVADSVIDATFFYPTEGHRIVQTALAILKGEKYSKENIMPTTSVVDRSNADVLLVQDTALREETEKMEFLKHRIDDYWAQHSSQTSLFYACLVILILLLGVVFLVLRAYWQHKRHQEVLLKQNKILEEERDKQRELNQRLEEATQSKLMFFTNVSHDLRTPLTLIAEPVSQLAKADNLTPRQHNLTRIANKNVKILQRLINQILDFRKYENNKLQLNLTEVDLASAVSDWIESFFTLARQREIKLSAEIEPKSFIMAVDVEKIERVVFNLLSNAFKYTPANGEISVTFSVNQDNAVITVSDTGEGISQRDLGSIFDRFYQVERVHPNGSGIGLTLSKSFIELHDGSIEVESELHKGSIFRVTLPIRHVQTAVREVQAVISKEDIEAELGVIEDNIIFDDDKPLLLVIDDNKDIQELITEVLRDDYNVIAAANGAEGLRKAAKYVPDLIICDLMMPVMDGLECCRHLKEEVSTSHIPVLMLTACSMDEQRVQGYESGADGYLSKPFSGEVLSARCKSLIANRRLIKDLWQKGELSTPVPEKPVAGDLDNDFYRRFIEIFNAEMGNSRLSVDTLAAKMGLERTQFYRKIKGITNFAPVELMRRLRLKRAASLLRTSDKSISEIAYETGFSTPAYFTRCYREQFGETPSETRTRLNL